MRTVGTIRAAAAVALVAIGGPLAVPAVALGTHRPTVEQVVAVATSETWGMGCEGTAGSVECSAADFDGTWFERASIRPGSGPLTGVDTSVTVRAAPLDPYFRDWHFALQAVPCAPDRTSAGQLSSFVGEVAARTTAGDATPVTVNGECALTGGLRIFFSDSGTEYTYWIRSAVVTPPTPTPTPSPTPTPTQRPTRTPAPTATPPASAVATATAVATPASASFTPSPTPEGSTAASGAGATPVASAGGSSSPTPEQQVLGGNPTPSPSAGDGAPAAPADPDLLPGRLVAGVAGAADISLEPAALAGSALLALLLLLFMGFAGELFNSTLESNYDEVAGWFGALATPAVRLARVWRGPTGLVAFLAVGAAVYALLDPDLSPDLGALATYLGLLIGLVTVLVSFELPGLLLYRRSTGQLPGLRALPWTLPAAAVCVLLSRVADLQPAYLYGILLGLVFARDLSPAEEGRQAAAGALWTLVVAVLAWGGLEWVRSGAMATGGFAPVVVETALAVAVVGGLEAVALGLLPMRFLAGAAVYRWRRAAWAVLYLASLFAFLHILVGPQTGYLAELDPAGLVLACGAFVAFGSISLAFWGYFRYRRARAVA